MIEPKFRWRLPHAVALGSDWQIAGEPFAASARLLQLLAARGLLPADVAGYLGGPEAGLHDPRRLPDADVALRRVTKARERGEGALVYGDFDADGITGLVILVITLRALGVDATPYVPERVGDGHGLSIRAVERAIAEGRRLIITADCGTTSGAEIAEAARRGVDVIVTDHHHAATWPAAAVATVNPHRPDSAYPESSLTGAGVAWKVASLLLSELGPAPLHAADLADLALIGTIADVAPALGENRCIAKLGLERLRTSPRPGIAALLRAAGVQARAVDLETIGFAIAPRLNAAGRVGEAARAARLLLAEHVAEADALAAELEEANSTRRSMTSSAVAEAGIALPEPVPAAILIQGEWPVGIIGLVAGRLAEEHHKPVVVTTLLDADSGLLRASCRSPKGFDLAAALVECADLLVRHGGHAQAAGFEIERSRWPEFETRFAQLAAERMEIDAPPELSIDLTLPAAAIDYALVRELALFEPSGPGNARPVVGVSGLSVSRVRAAAGGHTQLVLKRERDVLDGIAFRRADLVPVLHEGERVDVVAHVTSRQYGGFESLQLEVRDVASADLGLLARGSDAGRPAPLTTGSLAE